MADPSLTFISAFELAAMIKSKAVSPVEVVDQLLRRIERLNPRLNAYLAVPEEQAISAAREVSPGCFRISCRSRPGRRHRWSWPCPEAAIHSILLAVNPPTPPNTLSCDLAEIRAKLDRLEQRDAELRSAQADVEHDGRRCNDALERAGWHYRKVEARGAMLAESRRAIVDDWERNRALRAQLIEGLALLQKRLNETHGSG